VKFWTIIILVFQQLIDGETRDSDGFCSSGLNMKEVKGVGLKPSLKVIILLLHCHIEKCLDQESSRPSKCYESKAGTL